MRAIVAAASLLALSALAAPSDAQRNCVRGQPCGNTCISRDRVCRVGTGSAREGAAPREATRPAARTPRQPAGAVSASCTVQRITDGDTIVCDNGERVRLLLIDAPETRQGDFGLRAKLALEEMAPVGSTLRMETDVEQRDRYGRALAHAHTSGGLWINHEMVRRGYAVVGVYPPNVRHVERMRAAATEAREQGRGLWGSGGFVCQPADFRARRCR